MPLEQDLVEDETSHIGRILRADAQPGQQLGAQAFHLVFWKGGELDRLGKHVQQQGQILRQRPSAKTGGVRARVIPKSRADRFQRVVDLLHVAFGGAAHQPRAGKTRESQFVVRFKEVS